MQQVVHCLLYDYYFSWVANGCALPDSLTAIYNTHQACMLALFVTVQGGSWLNIWLMHQCRDTAGPGLCSTGQSHTSHKLSPNVIYQVPGKMTSHLLPPFPLPASQWLIASLPPHCPRTTSHPPAHWSLTPTATHSVVWSWKAGLTFQLTRWQQMGWLSYIILWSCSLWFRFKKHHVCGIYYTR